MRPMSSICCAAATLPPADAYDGMPQYSNGIGMTRDFVDGWSKAQRRLPARMPRPTELTLVCATLIAPVLQRVVDRLNRIENFQVTLLPVVNQFFGETVTVSGLLMAPGCRRRAPGQPAPSARCCRG